MITAALESLDSFCNDDCCNSTSQDGKYAECRECAFESDKKGAANAFKGSRNAGACCDDVPAFDTKEDGDVKTVSKLFSVEEGRNELAVAAKTYNPDG